MSGEVAMGNIQELFSKIQPCDMDKNFAFISYCSQDSQRVWQDVIHLQKLGYNIWIDKNIRETDPSWKHAAMEAIKDIDCKLVIFYLSSHSATSKPCLEELRCMESQEAMDNHGGYSIPWITIEVEPVGDIDSFRKRVFDSISSNLSVPREKRNAMSQTLSQLMNGFFPNNEKSRIKGIDDPRIKYDYYEKILEHLISNKIDRMTRQDMYIQSVNLFDTDVHYKLAVELLANCASDRHLPSILLYAFLQNLGIVIRKDPVEAKKKFVMAASMENASEWKSRARYHYDNKRFAVAAAYYSASGVYNQDSEALLDAARCWMKIEQASFLMTKRCAFEAAKLGNEDGKRVFKGLEKLPESKFIEFCQSIS